MLKGSAKDWYISLSQGSDHNFSQLGQMFLGRFKAHQAIMNMPIRLMSMKQGEGESEEVPRGDPQHEKLERPVSDRYFNHGSKK